MTLERTKHHHFHQIGTRDAFKVDVKHGLDKAPMAIIITPDSLPCINWANLVNDPVRWQFMALTSASRPDHLNMEFDFLHEKGDSPVPGLVRQYLGCTILLGKRTDDSLVPSSHSPQKAVNVRSRCPCTNNIQRHRYARCTVALARIHMQSAIKPLGCHSSLSRRCLSNAARLHWSTSKS
jgi:hypothetical protein